MCLDKSTVFATKKILQVIVCSTTIILHEEYDTVLCLLNACQKLGLLSFTEAYMVIQLIETTKADTLKQSVYTVLTK